MKHFLLFVEGDVEPHVLGPFVDCGARDAEAKRLRVTRGPAHGLFAVDVKHDIPRIWAYSAAFMEDCDG